MTDKITTEYVLSGGASCALYKPFEDNKYVAIVTIDGNYPEKGFVAKNEGRKEFNIVQKGAINYHINGAKHELAVGDTILVEDGDEYAINGKGKVIVMVEDKEGGKTEIYEK